MSNTAPQPIEDPAMAAMTIGIAHQLHGLADISLGAIADCLSEGTPFENHETFKEDLPRTGIDNPESLYTTLTMRYRAVWRGNEVDHGYQFSLRYGSEYGPPAYTHKYALLRRASGLVILQTQHGLDEEMAALQSAATPRFSSATAEQIRELKIEVERLREIPSGGVRVRAGV